MSDIRIIPAQNTGVSRVSGDLQGFIPARGTRDGALFVADWKQALIMEGRGFVANVGTFSTPAAGGGATAVIDQDRPNVVVSVPSGVAILPLRVAVQAQMPLLAADSDESEILIAVDTVVAAANGTSTAVTPVNLFTAHTRTTSCTARATHTANLSTVPTMSIELLHAVKVGDVQGTPATTMWTDLVALYEPTAVPVIAGPASLLVYVGGTTATTHFSQVCWLELPTSNFS